MFFRQLLQQKKLRRGKKMLDSKENEKKIDDFDYLSNAASARECTGLIPSIPMSEAELESYNDVYQYQPPIIPEKSEKTKKKS